MVERKRDARSPRFCREHGMDSKLIRDARRMAAAASARGLLRRGAATLLRGLLPSSCALCGQVCDETRSGLPGESDDNMLCAGCAAQFFGSAESSGYRCRCCANPLPDVSALCGACSAHPPAFDVTLVASDYAIPIDQLVLQLKFGHRLALAALFARLLRDAVLRRPDFVLPALLCPVPLGPRRLAERGYNQSLEIARPLARSLGVALHPQLASRVRETVAQSSVAPEQRQQNIAGAFAIPDPALVQGRHIGIVDDVMTSGRTLNELAATLKRHGAARVSNLVFARTPPH
jgi:ComF family protein